MNPSKGTEAGKTRPVLVVQSNLLNPINHSTLVIPITSKILSENAEPVRLNIDIEHTGLKKASALLIDQIRAIDNTRLQKQIGKLQSKQIPVLKKCIFEILDF